MGGIDVLINNAGFGYNAEIGALDMNTMRKLFATNVFGIVDITNRVVPHMKAQQARRHRQHRVDVGHEGREGRAPSTPAASGRCAASRSAGRRSCARTAFA